MKILLFGATGMIGQGVLRECLLDPEVTEVVAMGRGPSGQSHAKLRDVVVRDLTDYAGLEAELTGVAACLFCLGVSAAGMSEADYRRITYDLTLAAAQALARSSPGATFVYVSGAGTDSSERGRWMWARVKGETENALLRLPLGGVFLARPGYIQPVHGITSRTRAYRFAYAILGPMFPLWRRLMPRQVLTTEDLGRAMLQVAKHGADKKVLESGDLNDLGHAYARPD